MQRRRELDFLRGVAIILVLFRHAYLTPYTKNMGWIGVDLFFVLSGFLVSGLLFKEYIKFGNIRPKRFLIRRGFKIYPIYYLFYSIYLLKILNHHELSVQGLLADLTFTQNYVLGYGYAYAASWSLAVEEHFYLGLSLAFWWGFKYNKIHLPQAGTSNAEISRFEIVLLLTMTACLLIRLYTNTAFPSPEFGRNSTMTHLRIDSLLAGVLISYLYYFKRDFLVRLVGSGRYLLLAIAIACVSWTPFIDPDPSFFAKTAGFTLLYISFGILLVYFLVTSNINQQLNKLFSAPIANGISKIGYCSYSIYIIHSFVNFLSDKICSMYPQYYNHYLNFLLTSALSVALGMLMTYKVESYFLRLRDKYYPSRAA